MLATGIFLARLYEAEERVGFNDIYILRCSYLGNGVSWCL